MYNQKTVSTYLYPLYVTQKDTKPNTVSECESGLFFLIFDIRYLTFAVKLITYWIFETFSKKL